MRDVLCWLHWLLVVLAPPLAAVSCPTQSLPVQSSKGTPRTCNSTALNAHHHASHWQALHDATHQTMHTHQASYACMQPHYWHVFAPRCFLQVALTPTQHGALTHAGPRRRAAPSPATLQPPLPTVLKPSPQHQQRSSGQARAWLDPDAPTTPTPLATRRLHGTTPRTDHTGDPCPTPEIPPAEERW